MRKGTRSRVKNCWRLILREMSRCGQGISLGWGRLAGNESLDVDEAMPAQPACRMCHPGPVMNCSWLCPSGSLTPSAVLREAVSRVNPPPVSDGNHPAESLARKIRMRLKAILKQGVI